MKCWNCFEHTMVECLELGSGWHKCTKCGATWIKPLELEPLPVAGTWTDETGIKHYKSHKVTTKRRKHETTNSTTS